MNEALRILVVDDDPDVLNGTARLLERAGYAVDTACSGEASLQAVQRHPPDLLLVDYEMPGMDGLEVCRQIKRDPALAEIFVIILSGNRVDSDDQAEGLESGADGYVARPVPNRELLARIRAFARIMELTRALRQTEKVMRESQAKLQESQRISLVGSWQFDLASDHVEWSEELHHIFGLNPDLPVPDFSEQSRLFTPESWQRLSAAVSHTQQTGVPYELELEIIRPGGGHAWILGRGEAVRDATHAVVGLQGVALDISERKQMESYHEMGTEIVQILAEPGPLRSLIQPVLATVKARTGFDAVGIRLKDGEDFPYIVQDGFPEDFLRSENSLLQRNAEGGVCRDSNGQVRLECTCGLVISGKANPDNPLFTRGGSFWINDSSPLLSLPRDQDPRLNPRNQCIHHGYASIALVPIRTKDKIIGLLQLNDRRKDCFSAAVIEQLEGIAAHLGEALLRKRAEQELQESEARVRAITDSAQDAILMMNPHGDVSYWNPAAEGMLGYTSSEAIGQSLHDLIAPLRYHPAHQAAFPAFQKTGQGSAVGQTLDLVACRKDGQEISVQLSLSALQRNDGWHSVGILRDITERKRAEAKLQQTNEQLERATAQAEMASIAKSEFLANMSHEIRTPLNGVLGMIDLLLDTSLTEEQRRYAQIVRASGDALISLINNILDFSKIEVGKLELEQLNFCLHNLLDDFTATMALQAHEKGLVLNCVIAPEVPADLRGDPNRLRQILLNLTGNAIKFTAQGQVTLRVSVMSKTSTEVLLRFAVHDTGLGIPHDKLEKLFVKFSQVDSSTTRTYGGTGLGLAISKQLAELMGGEVGVRSQPGKGSEFWFTVPLARATSSGQNSLSPPAGSRSGLGSGISLGQARVLVAEDNITNQQVALGILKKLGLRAKAVGNGLEAIQTLQTSPYEIVLMDVQMPVMDGLVATQRIRDPQSRVLNPQIPILAMTAHALQGDREKCLAAGMNDYLTKPIDIAALIAALKRWLPPPGEPKVPVFDRAALMQRVMNDEELAHVVIEGFLGDMPAQISQLKAAARAEDAAHFEEQAHKIKGASATLGGEALCALAAGLEQMGQGGDLNTISGRLAELDAQFEALKEALLQELRAKGP